MQPGNIAEMSHEQLKELPDNLGVERLLEGSSMSAVISELDRTDNGDVLFDLHAHVWLRFDGRIELSFSATGDPRPPLPDNKLWVFESVEQAEEFMHRLKAVLRKYTPHIHTTDDRDSA